MSGIGLISDNTVVIVASMLVSPIMGPVMGMVSSLGLASARSTILIHRHSLVGFPSTRRLEVGYWIGHWRQEVQWWSSLPFSSPF